MTNENIRRVWFLAAALAIASAGLGARHFLFSPQLVRTDEAPAGYFLEWNGGKITLKDSSASEVRQWTISGIPKANIAHAELLPDGTVLALLRERMGLVWLESDGHVAKHIRIDTHHEFDISRDRIIAWAKEEGLPAMKHIVESEVIRNDYLVEFDKNGIQTWRWDTIDAIDALRAIDVRFPRESRPADGDWSHANAVRYLPESDLASDTRFRPGNLLVSFRDLNLICIIDYETKAIVWSFPTDVFEQQHSPEMGRDGTIYVFDNGIDREFSRILAIDPIKNEIKWSFGNAEDDFFYSNTGGRVQETANGDLLVSVRNCGQSFRLKNRTERTWEYRNSMLEEISPDKLEFVEKHCLVGKAPNNRWLRRSAQQHLIWYEPNSEEIQAILRQQAKENRTAYSKYLKFFGL